MSRPLSIPLPPFQSLTYHSNQLTFCITNLLLYIVTLDHMKATNKSNQNHINMSHLLFSAPSPSPCPTPSRSLPPTPSPIQPQRCNTMMSIHYSYNNQYHIIVFLSLFCPQSESALVLILLLSQTTKSSVIDLQIQKVLKSCCLVSLNRSQKVFIH